MHIAIAGAGGLSRYLCEELVPAGHEITLLSRRHEPAFQYTGMKCCATDYSIKSLQPLLDGPEVLISAISDDTNAYVQVHEALLAACSQSPTCKRLIPSEYAGIASDDSIEPSFYNWTRRPVRKLLSEQNQVEYTLVCSGWLADYFVPARNRYVNEVGSLFPFDPYTGTLVIPGTGNEMVEFIWMRDLARALGQLVEKPKWEQLTFISAIRTTWNEISAVLRARNKLNTVTYAPSDDGKVAEGLDLFVQECRRSFTCGTFDFPTSTAAAHRDRFFSGVTFRSLQDGFSEITDDADRIV